MLYKRRFSLWKKKGRHLRKFYVISYAVLEMAGFPHQSGFLI